MKIVYSLSGEGRGHGSLALAVLPALQRAGPQRMVVTYGQSLDRLAGYDVLPIRGIKHFYDRGGRLSLPISVFRNAGVLAYYCTSWPTVRRQLRKFAPDLFIVNFEPFTPLIARSLNVPVISFDNQHALLCLKEGVPPGQRFPAWTTKSAIRLVAPWARHYLITTIAAVAPARRNTHIVPLVVNGQVRQIQPTNGTKVLVYLKHPNARFLETLKQTDEQFVVYGYDTAAIDRNLTFRAFNSQMPAELGASKAVMGTAGLSLISEALWLKKPFFAIPLKNEFEQMVSAMAVRRLGFGDFAEEPSPEQIKQFFANLAPYRESLRNFHFDPDAAANKLIELVASVASENGR